MDQGKWAEDWTWHVRNHGTLLREVKALVSFKLENKVNGTPAHQVSISEPRKNSTCYPAAIDPACHKLLSFPMVNKEYEYEYSNCRMLAQDSWDTYERNDFSKPRLLHLPIQRKVLNSLTWDIWLSLINNNLSVFRLPVPCCKLLYKLTPPSSPASPEVTQLFQGYLKCCLPGLKF